MAWKMQRLRPLCLAPVHATVGQPSAQQLLRPGCRAGVQRNAHAGAHLHGVPSTTMGSMMARSRRSAPSARTHQIAQVAQEHHKFIAPSRAAVSPVRMCACRRYATITSSSSPASWPWVSLTALKPSISRKHTASPCCSLHARAMVWARRSGNRARLGRRVSGSKCAWRSRCSWWCLRSVMSGEHVDVVRHLAALVRHRVDGAGGGVQAAVAAPVPKLACQWPTWSSASHQARLLGVAPPDDNMPGRCPSACSRV